MRLVIKVMAALALVTASGGIGLGATNCGFLTLEQCRATLTGGSSFCVPNQFYNPRGTAKHTRNPTRGTRGARLRDAVRSLSVVRLYFGPLLKLRP